MKWGGWIILPLLFLIHYSFTRHYCEEEKKLKLQLSREVANTEINVNEQLDKIKAILPNLDARLAAERVKTNEIIAKNQALTGKISGLATRENELNTQIDSLNSARSDTQSKKKENLQEIKALQKKITALQQDIAKLKTHLQTVTDI